jgi:hypothetical protein
MADGDVALLERGVGIGRGEVGLEPLDELAPQVPDALADATQRGRTWPSASSERRSRSASSV